MPNGTSSKSYLAFDFGAESGRAILGRLHVGVLTTQEVRRFRNGPLNENGRLHWDVARLFNEAREALSGLEESGLVGIGVDTWGVDYALLGVTGELLQKPYHYRDTRTVGMMERVFREVPKEEIYQATGVQFLPINTLYQVYAAALETPSLLKVAHRLVTIADLFNSWFTGKTVCEFTNATTTQLVNARTRTWARELIERLALPSHLWGEIVEPGTILGRLQPGVTRNSTLSETTVIAPATHDTGSAVAAISARDGTAFLSSGTWSLLGTEIDAPLISPEAMQLNFTNEGGVNGTTRLLKNVMGLGLLQCCRQKWLAEGQCAEQTELLEAAVREEPFASLVDPDHESFLRLGDMPGAIVQFCKRTQQPAPRSPAAFTRSILESLAFKYRVVMSSLEKLTGKHIEQIRVIGGGSKNRLLNQLTADATGRTVFAGPSEATALGNVAIQMLATGAVGSLSEARAIIERSYPTETFEPRNSDQWDRQTERFRHLCEAVYA